MKQLLCFGDFELDTDSFLLQRAGAAVSLPLKAVHALELLAAAPGRLLTRQALIDALWADRVVEEQGLSQLVYLLRRTLGPRSDGRNWIETVPKRGYRFNGDVERAEQPPLARPAHQPTPTVVVLPLRETACSEAGLGLALADALVTLLARHAGLVVRPLGNLQKQIEDIGDPVALGRALGADLLVEGGLQTIGSSLRVTVRLWGGGLQQVLWSERFDSELTELFALEDAIGAALLQCMLPAGSMPLPASPVQRSPNAAVREHLLRCNFLWHRWNPAAWYETIVTARAALALDGANAEARCWWGVALTTLAISGQIEGDPAFRQARALFHEAERRDPHSDRAAEGLAAVALFHDWDPATAIVLLQRAIRSNPGNVTARDLYGLALVASGDVGGAVREVRGALQIDPLSLIVGTDHGAILMLARRYTESAPALRRVLSIDPGFAHARINLGLLLALVGDGAAAQTEIRRGLADFRRDPATSHELAHALVAAGDQAAAHAILDAQLALQAERYVDPFEIASTCVALDKPEQAMELLAQALRCRSRALCYIRVDPIFDPLRGRADFLELVDRVFPPVTA